METSLSAAPSRSEVAPSTGKAGLAAAGGILGALAASSCCIVPLALFTLGTSGAWIGNLTALARLSADVFRRDGRVLRRRLLPRLSPAESDVRRPHLRAAAAGPDREGGSRGGHRADGGGRRV